MKRARSKFQSAGVNLGRGIIPLSELAWAREQAENGIDIGAEIERPSQVLTVGDVVWVEPVEIEPEIFTDDLGQEIEVPVAYAYPAYGLRQVPGVNGGILAMDPHTGRVLAMVGGYSFDASEFNRATQARRQPGSSFKPFVYAAALDAGHTPSDLILDAPFVMPQGEGLPLWRPDNYTDRFYGPSDAPQRGRAVTKRDDRGGSRKTSAWSAWWISPNASAWWITLIRISLMRLVRARRHLSAW